MRRPDRPPDRCRDCTRVARGSVGLLYHRGPSGHPGRRRRDDAFVARGRSSHGGKIESVAQSAASAAARFRGTRAAHRDETGEDYVEAIDQLARSERGARVKDLAAMMGVSHVTVVRIVSRLARRGLVATARGRPMRLTASGKRLAARARKRHQAVLEFLWSVGVPRAQAVIDAEGIEHHVSEATIRALRRVTAGVRSRGGGIRAAHRR